MDIDSMVSRFTGIKPMIEEILSVSGVVGLSYGILHQGQIIHTESFGYRDYEQKLPVDTQTMFPICSMTKGLVSSALGLLVEKGKLKWETPVHELLPCYAPVRCAEGKCDLTRLLSYTLGLGGVQKLVAKLQPHQLRSITEQKGPQ